MANKRLRRTIRSIGGIDELIKWFSGATFLWLLAPDGILDDSGFLHHSFAWLAWREANARKRLHLLTGLAVWPIAMPAAVLYYTLSNGPGVRARTGKALLRQAAEQLGLAARHAVLPPWYYIYDLHEDAKRPRAREYLNRFEVKRCVYPFVRQHYARVEGMEEGGSRMFVSSKLLFAQRCAEHDIPVAPVLAIAEKGEVRTVGGGPVVLPEADLFTKPTRGCGGRGAMRWEYQGGGLYRPNEGAALRADELVAAVRQRSLRESVIVQPRLVNHAELRELTPGALCTVRALTCRNERDGFELTHAVFRMPSRRDASVDNFHQGGIAAPIDLATGTLGRATDLGLERDSMWHATHPLTGGRILGRALPYWREVADLVVRAHAAFPDLVTLGWDVAILEDGPCLIEANKGPDVDLIQRPHAAPLGSSRFGQLLAFHLDKALRARYSGVNSMPTRGRYDAVSESELPGIV